MPKWTRNGAYLLGGGTAVTALVTSIVTWLQADNFAQGIYLLELGSVSLTMSAFLLIGSIVVSLLTVG